MPSGLEVTSSPADIRRHKEQRWTTLETDRSTWFTHWKDVSQHILPRSGRYFLSNTNRGGAQHYNNIYDSSATKALRTIAAGMMAGATSPARPWFRLRSEDPDLNDFHPVRLWLDDVVQRMQHVFAKSNTYRTLHTKYEELAAFGTSVSMIAADFDNVIHLYPSPVGEYCLAQDYKGRVNALYRRFQRTVSEVVFEFGDGNVSHQTMRLFDQGKFDHPVEILHAIEQRKERDETKADPKNMPWSSCHLEMGAGKDEGMLRVSGFKAFPVLAPRWTVNAGDVYGTSPGMEALGDVKQLQQEQLRKGQAIDYQTRPPLQVPTSLAHRDREMFPGGITYHDQATPHGGIRTSFDVTLDLGALLLDIEDVRRRINSAFFADLFLMLSQSPPGQGRLTATEVAERHEEKLLQLGPVLERVHNELLQPLIDITFTRMLEVGLIPEPPEELEGQELGVDFVSILAQAQRAIGMNSIDRWVGGLLAVAQSKPEALDKLNVDELADISAERLGVDPQIVIATAEAAKLREARNNALAAQQQVEAMNMQADTAQKLANSPTSGKSALTDTMANLTSL